MANRLKIRTHPPLGPFQAWVPFNPDQSINSLKINIINLLQPNHPTPLKTKDILLELDAFAFLDQSPCSLIDPAHDLIDVKLVAPPPCDSPAKSTTKRQRSQSKVEKDSKASHQKSSTLASTHLSNAQAVQGPAKASSDETSRIKPKSRDDRPIKPLPASNDKQPSTEPTRKPPAPPGQGKPSTRARNQRKRLKKMRSREQNKSIEPKQNHLVQKPTRSENHVPENPPSASKSQVPLPAERVSNSSKNNQSCSTIQKNPLDKRSMDISSGSSSSKSKSSSSGSDSSSSTSDSSSSGSDSSSSTSDSSSSTSDSSSSTSDSLSSTSDSDSSKPSSSSLSPQPVLSALSDEASKTCERLKSPAPILQKNVPIVPNPLLSMLSLSNKNKRKYVKRKSCPDRLSHPTKIVFGSPNRRLTSPCFVPASPNRTIEPETSPDLQQTNSNRVAEDDFNNYKLAHHQNVYWNGDESFITTSNFPTHGPPPSVRDPKLVPSNIIISSVNVLNPYWTPGQIGKQQTWVSQETYNGVHSNNYAVRTNNKRKRKNRKKGLKKRRRMAAKSRTLDQNINEEEEEEERVHSEDEDEYGEEAEIQKEVEEAYQEFIKTGGHSRSTDVTNSVSGKGDAHVNEKKELIDDDGGFKKSLRENWDQFGKLDYKSAVVGSFIAIRTWEISTESFTPELVIYYGKIMESNEEKLTMKLDERCIPIKYHDESDPESKRENQVENNEVDIDDEEEEERSVDVKEAIRKSHREALINHLCGHPSRDLRHWDWNNILDARVI